MRLDTTLVDFNDMKWVRGDIAFIYNGDAGPDTDLAVLDNQVHHHPIRHHSFRLVVGPDTDLAVLDNQVHHHPIRHHSFRASCWS